MVGHIVKLVFQAIAQGSGIEKASQDTAALRKNLGMAGQAANMLGQAFGDIGHLAGGAIAAIAVGNFWQLGALACNKLVSVIKGHNKLMADAKLAARGLSREYMSLEAAAAGYRKRVEEWKKAKSERDDAEKKAAEARKEAIKVERDGEEARLNFEQKYYELEQKISEEKRKAGVENESELEKLKAKIAFMREEAALAVRNAKGNLEFANANGTGYDKDLAAKNLELAKAQEASVKVETDKMMADFDKAEKKKSEAKRKEESDFTEFVRKQREKLDEEIQKRQDKDREREMRDELDATRELASKKEQMLADAKAKAEASHNILANAAGMDQAADIKSAAQEEHMNDRFEKRSKALQERLKKVGGDPSKLGRLSNIDKAILDRMQTEKVKDDATSELKKLNQKFDNLTQQLKELTQL